MQTEATQIEFRKRISSPARCPHCGDLMIAARASEFVDTGEVRHHWACDDCGQDFSTTVILRH